MKTLLQFKLALLLVIVLPKFANSQFTNPERDTKWNIGINMGGVWQDGDIKLDRPGFGYGFTIGKGIYEGAGKFWSIDARFRYMKGFTYGQDTAKTLSASGYLDNPIYSTNPTNYRGNIGFTYLNSKTMIHDFSLEGVANFHMLREKTGVLLSVFGGLGVTDYRTKTDLGYYKEPSDSLIKFYNYTQSSDISERDGDYESNAVYNEDVTIKFMPSLGIGLGYQITPQWSFGFEHRVTFALDDKFDGIKKEGTQFLQWGDNDKYHYSSLFLRLNIFRGEHSSSTSSDKCPPPYLKIADIPAVYTVNEKDFSIRARVSKIKSNNDIILVSNDQMIETVYSTNTDYVSGNITLIEGENKILFIASNACGESMDSVLVIYNPEFCPKSVIAIAEPEAIVKSRNAKLIAKVLQLQEGTLQVRLNNSIVTHQYNNNSRILTADLNLNVGANTVSIKGINKCGDTTVFKNIEYKCIPPTVVINSPVNGKKIESQTNQAKFNAKANNVNELSQVQVLINGVVVTPTLNKTNGEISGGFTMREGSNTVSVSVTNDCGTDTKSIQFVYEKPCLLPVISVSAPRNNQNVFTSSTTVTASVTNIASNSNVSLRVNGVVVNSNFNNGGLSAVVNLRLGSNTIVLTGTNVCGTDSKTINITYSCPTPVVTINSPTNGAVLSSGNSSITGSVSHVTSKNQVNITVNGNAVPFTFNTSNGTFNAPVTFNTGQNVILVAGNTNCGSDSKTITVSVNLPCPAPVVNVLNPANGSNLSTNVVTLTGTVLNVSNQSQMRISINGVTQSLSYNSVSKTFSSSLNLRTGNNTIVVSATTNCGTDSKTINLLYNAPCPLPIVVIASPVNGASIKTSALVLSGTAVNVNSQSQLRVTVNGVNKSFSYNSTTKVYTATLSLSAGNNTIAVIATTNCGTNTKSVNVVYNKSCPKPIVTISSPRNGLNSTVQTTTFVGNVQNATSANQITLKLNGVVVNKSFNTTTRIVTATLNLKQGGNIIELSATNSCGSDSKVISASFKCPLPSINIASPNTGMRYTTNPIAFSGFVSGISTKSQIKVSLNGSVIPFTYDASTSKFSGNMTMKEGSNILEASVTNQCGTGIKTTTVTYTKPCPKPTVLFTSPVNGNSVNTSSVSITGVVNNLSSQADMQLKVNGVNTVFTYNASTKLFSATANLTEGNNTMSATVTTNCGSETKTINVSYVKLCPKPTVTILNPASGSTSIDQLIKINGVTANVVKSQMTLTLNGNAIPFTFNANTFTASSNLLEGNNMITATVTNNCGTQTKSTSIEYTKPCPKPVLVISSPTNGSTITTGLVTVSGTVTNIQNATQISILINGTKVSHNYNAVTKQFSVQYDMKLGSNIIVVTLTNSCGSVSKTVNTSYVPPCPRPTISILTPANGASIVGNTVTVIGVTKNLQSKADMEVRVNGVAQAFIYNDVTKAYSSSVTLVAGKNDIVVNTSTNCGTGSSAISVNSTLLKPIIRVIIPSADTTKLTVNSLKINGLVERINSQSQFTIVVNGVVLKQFTFKKITNEKYSFDALVNLNHGANVITYRAVHSSGTVEVITNVVNVTNQLSSLKDRILKNQT